jgi:CheY-like chemotaxis protein
MDLDIVSVKMAVVGGPAAQREVLRSAAGMAPVPIEVVEFDAGPTASMQDRLTRGAADIVILDCDLAPATHDALTQAARAAKRGAIVILLGAPGEPEAESPDADVVLETPIDVAKASALIERCARARRPNRVLVVDDSPTIRSIVRKMMRVSRFSLTTEEADDGTAALDLMRSGRFDIVFLDCNMPGLDGFATLAEIKRNHPGIATVMMTGTPDQSIAVRARVAGAKGFLFKPFFPKDIDAVLHGLFGLNAPRAARV